MKKSKIEKITKIIGKDNTYAVLTEEECCLNGNALEIIFMIQGAVKSIVAKGFPREMAKELLEIACLDKEGLLKKAEESLKKLEEMEKKNETSDKQK